MDSHREPQWWERDADIDRANALWRIVDHLWSTQGQPRAQDAEDYLVFYFGNERYGLSGFRTGPGPGVISESPGYNLIQACADTSVAQTVKNRVRPFFLTEKGNQEEQERAQGMTKACEGTLREAGLYGPMALDVCFHGELYDGGVIKIEPDFANSRVLVDVVDPWKIMIPEREAATRKPRQFFYYDRVDRAVLLSYCRDMGEEVLEAIRSAPPARRDSLLDDPSTEDGDTVSDLIDIAEGWHLPSGRVDRKKPASFGLNKKRELDPSVDPEHDGARILAIRDHVIAFEPWPFDRPPFAFYLPRKRPNAFWSRGTPETLLGAQMTINRMNSRVDAIMHLHARPLLYVWSAAKINKEKITNAYANIIQGMQPAGQALQYITPQSVPAEYLARIDRIIDWGKEQAGIPDTSIQANRPAGIEHAPALQFLADVESIRHTPKFQAWEEFYVQASRRIVDCLRLLAERDPDFEIMWGDSKELKRVKWREADLDDDRFIITVWPTNLLPQTPAAKVARVIELMKNGLLDREKAVMLLDFPDITAALGDSNAALRNIEEKLRAAVEGDEVRAMAHPYLALELAFQLGKDRLNALEADGADEDVLDRVRTFVEDVDQLIQLQLAAQPAPAAPAEALPPPPAPALPPAPMPVQ